MCNDKFKGVQFWQVKAKDMHLQYKLFQSRWDQDDHLTESSFSLHGDSLDYMINEWDVLKEIFIISQISIDSIITFLCIF